MIIRRITGWIKKWVEPEGRLSRLRKSSSAVNAWASRMDRHYHAMQLFSASNSPLVCPLTLAPSSRLACAEFSPPCACASPAGYVLCKLPFSQTNEGFQVRRRCGACSVCPISLVTACKGDWYREVHEGRAKTETYRLSISSTTSESRRNGIMASNSSYTARKT